MIELKDIVVKFGDFEALHNINVNVKEGEFFTFLGPSGCGKTTTLRTITGFIEPVSGTVSVNEQDITHVPIEKRNIGIVFQMLRAVPDDDGVRQHRVRLEAQKAEKAGNRPEGAGNCAQGRFVRRAAQKGGQPAVRRSAAARCHRRALVTGPSIICMDEPLSNLDAKLRVQLRNELKKMQREFGITTIYVTHDQEEALTLSDRIAVFNKGYIEQIERPERDLQPLQDPSLLQLHRRHQPRRSADCREDETGGRAESLHPSGTAARQQAQARR